MKLSEILSIGLSRKGIPIELRKLIEDYLYEQLNNDNFRYAVKYFLYRRTLSIELRFGNICDWDTSKVTNMSNMFRDTLC